MKDPIKYLAHATHSVLKSLDLPDVEPQFEKPKNPSHGDIATNVAFVVGAIIGKPPPETARLINEGYSLQLDTKEMARHTVAEPGFINFVLAPEHLRDVGRSILEEGAAFGNGDELSGQRILLEFVSANPSGPLNIVSARAAAVGDSLRRILGARGARVDSEYYVNDAGNQVRLLGESLRARYETLLGYSTEVPEEGYHGAYLIDMARAIIEREGDKYHHQAPAEAAGDLVQIAIQFHVEQHREILERFRVPYSRWFRESELHSRGAPQAVLDRMDKAGALFRQDGAHSVRTSSHGDSKDWVVITSAGQPTYFLPDIAYHVDKFHRGYGELLNILGPDHHHFPSRMKAAMRILGLPAEKLHVIILQQVNLLRDGVAVKMSKRAGEIVEMEELVSEVGVDATRYFFVLRRTTTPLDFDIELAKSQSEENPVYYVQYAHARIASIFRKAQISTPDAAVDWGLLTHVEELNLLRRLRELPQVTAECAAVKDPHALTTWLREVATQFHRFYHHCRVLGEEKDLQRARLALCRATQIAIARGLDLLGVSAPEAM
ncbi:MAG: arginine--tRNA ligase [bacterium]